MQCTHNQEGGRRLTHFDCRQGAQGTYDSASKSTLSAHFDTENVDDVIQQILVKGTSQVMEVRFRLALSAVPSTVD